MKLIIYSEKDHKIALHSIDSDALDIIYKLQAAGHTAYLVGGSVRDLLLRKTPKDFDISTSARPEEIRAIFQRRCLLIGRRFRLAHVRCHNKIFEVSTFRSGTNTSALLMRDNHYGTEEEDVLRRDFTINALFYDPTSQTIFDYVGGVADIHSELLRSIGDPISRFKQDPVRMIRLLKFKARFQFSIEDSTEQALHICRDEILKSSPERLIEEMFKMLESGASKPFFELLESYAFLDLLFPCFDHFLKGKNRLTLLAYLLAIDGIQKTPDVRLNRSLLLSSLVFPILEQEIVNLVEDRKHNLSQGDVQKLSLSLLKGINTSSFAHFPKKLLIDTHAIISSQFRLTPIYGTPKLTNRFGTKEHMNLALIFLKLRCLITPKLKHAYYSWKKKIA